MIVPAGTQHQFVNTGPTPLVSRIYYSSVIHPLIGCHRFCTQSILPQSIIRRQYTRPRRKAMKRKKTGKTNLRTGAQGPRQKTRKQGLFEPTGSTTKSEYAPGNLSSL